LALLQQDSLKDKSRDVHDDWGDPVCFIGRMGGVWKGVAGSGAKMIGQDGNPYTLFLFYKSQVHKNIRL
jgi:hypothetical protein